MATPSFAELKKAKLAKKAQAKLEESKGEVQAQSHTDSNKAPEAPIVKAEEKPTPKQVEGNTRLEDAVNQSMSDPYSLGMIPLDAINIGDKQVRTDGDRYTEEELEDLALTIYEDGLFKPVMLIPVDDGRYDLEQGEHRYKAHDLLRKSEKIRGVVIKNRQQFNFIAARKAKPGIKDLRQLKENIFHKAMNPVSEAKVISGLMEDHGWTQDEVKDYVKKSQSWVSRRLALLKESEEVQEKLNSGEVTRNQLAAEKKQKAKVTAKKSNGSAKLETEKLVKVPVEKGALTQVCKLLSVLSEQYDLPEVTVSSTPTNMEIKKTIEQRIAEVLNAARKQ